MKINLEQGYYQTFDGSLVYLTGDFSQCCYPNQMDKEFPFYGNLYDRKTYEYTCNRWSGDGISCCGGSRLKIVRAITHEQFVELNLVLDREDEERYG